MKYCAKCGQQIHDEAVICVHCGCAVAPPVAAPQPMASQPVMPVDESVSAGLVVLAVLIPLFGIIYWPVKAKERPNCARACGVAAIISWAISFIFIMAIGG